MSGVQAGDRPFHEISRTLTKLGFDTRPRSKPVRQIELHTHKPLDAGTMAIAAATSIALIIVNSSARLVVEATNTRNEDVAIGWFPSGSQMQTPP